jgi:hypothetical protein
MIRHQARRNLWNNILIASSLPFFAAYGDVNNPFSRDNLILTASLVGWMVGDEVIDRFTRGGGKNSNNRLWRRGTNTWSYIAPVGNALTVWALLKDRQHERYLTGISKVTPGTELPVDLTTMVAKDYKDTFSSITTVRVVASLLEHPNLLQDGDNTLSVAARVEAGTLKLKVTGDPSKQVDVAWIIDLFSPGNTTT